jgi:hypothetical protein
MNVGTGQTVYEQIISLDVDNNSVTGATFDTTMYRDGASYTGATVSIALSDASRGVFTASWSASTTGDYQLYAKNLITSVVFIADNVVVKSDSELSTSVYIGI